jgi:hypothetical protein
MHFGTEGTWYAVRVCCNIIALLPYWQWTKTASRRRKVKISEIIANYGVRSSTIYLLKLSHLHATRSDYLF